MEISGKRVLLTGASKGLGAALAVELARRGAEVALVARSVGAIEALANELGGRAYPADLCDPAQARDLLGRVESDWGPVHVLVNNAGVEHAGSIVDVGPEDIMGLFAVNLVAPALLAAAAARRMLGRGEGHIVNISSLAGVGALPGLAAYSASKAALTHFTAGLRADLRGTGVGTTVVELGPVRTDMYARVASHRPTAEAFRRLLQLRMMSEVDADLVAVKLVQALEHGRRHVRLPQRAALSSLIQELPRRMTEYLLTGISVQD